VGEVELVSSIPTRLKEKIPQSVVEVLEFLMETAKEPVNGLNGLNHRLERTSEIRSWKARF
jgi:hypothetical protein